MMRSLLLIAFILAYAQASAIRKMDDMDARMTERVAAIRHQRFNSEKTPLETLFTMQHQRKEDLQNNVSDMLKQARLHSEARQRLQEEMTKQRK